MDLNTQVVAYLTVNNISFTSDDFQIGQPINEPVQILEWNTVKLGAEPTQAQLDAATIIYEGQQIAAQNKQQATSLLQQTDWTSIPDVANPQYSNPCLMNQDAFLAYRSTVRNIAVNPPTTPAVFPEQPQEIWSN